jgi:hypothetical protein
MNKKYDTDNGYSGPVSLDDDAMPRGMDAQRGMGDIEEAMQIALPDMDVPAMMPEFDDQEVSPTIPDPGSVGQQIDRTVGADYDEKFDRLERDTSMPVVDIDDPGELDMTMPDLDPDIMGGR